MLIRLTGLFKWSSIDRTVVITHCLENGISVSPQRAKRPWLGQIEEVQSDLIPAYDPDCYLCPGNLRAGSKRNPSYQGTYVFDNDFPALLQSNGGDVGKSLKPDNPIFRSDPVSGICRVVCFSPRHDLTLPELSLTEVKAVIDTWTRQTVELGGRGEIEYVQVFENKGAVMGCSNPHPHSQIWASSFIPNEPANELLHLDDYLRDTGGCLLCDTVMSEKEDGRRIVADNDHFLAIVPFWAVWPFELLIISKNHLGSLVDLSHKDIFSLSEMLHKATTIYDNLFGISFPYSMGLHQKPTDGKEHPEAHLHLHFYPPLLRSALIRKFMVGYEMLAMPQRDLTPEIAAEKLRNISITHFKKNNSKDIKL